MHERQATPSTEETQEARPLAAWFLGPRAENARVWEESINYIFQDYIHWRRNYFPSDPVVVSRFRRRSQTHEAWLDELTAHLDYILNELKAHFPFHSPRYLGHMLSEQTLPSVLGWITGMLFNPNNVTDEAAPITVELELEVSRSIATMLGYKPQRSWAHLTSGGTIANLEALWVARSTQFVPFTVREYCRTNRVDFHIKTPNLMAVAITEADDRTLLSLRPNEAIFMLRKLAHHLHTNRKQPAADVVAELNKYFQESPYNPARKGFAGVLALVGLRPVIFVSAAAHYSIKKAADILGYGEDAVKLIPTTSRFQVNLDVLRDEILRTDQQEYVAAVVGIVGTTEEGAVDPIHRILALREQFHKQHNRSFWLHADAAWGGYICSLFQGWGSTPSLSQAENAPAIDEQFISIAKDYVRKIRATEKFQLPTGIPSEASRGLRIRWTSRDLYASFLGLGEVDSITVDPHKMGYIPYPAGVVAFRNGVVTEMISQRAQYISDDEGGMKGIDEPTPVSAVGPFILEGSKPGAAALACWLAHKTIPLDNSGHGKVIRTSLLNARKLHKYMISHRYMFQQIQDQLVGEESEHPFTFVPLYEPDTNIICYVAREMSWHDGELLPSDTTLARMNYLNRKIYSRLSIPASQRKTRTSQNQAFFVSRTVWEQNQYSIDSIRPILKSIPVPELGYADEGIFVLRSVVMNPWYYGAEEVGINYLLEFVRHLHIVTHSCIEDTYEERRAAKMKKGH